MGKKIPGRKHRGVKYPEKQASERLEKIKDKINAPPSNPDSQETPKSLLRIIELKNRTKNGEFGKRRKKKNNTIEEDKSQTNTRPNMFGLPFTQKPGETDESFVRRVNYYCMNVTKEAEFENKFGVQIKRGEEGKVEAVVKRPKDELEILMKQIKKEKRKKKLNKKCKSDETPRLSKSQKWQNKKKEKKMKKVKNKSDEFEKFKDTVKFGETVHAPPAITVKKVGKELPKIPRPGNRNLLLKSMFPEKGIPNVEGRVDHIRTSNKVINRKGKRRDLPNALRRQLDSQQKDIIAAYKDLKAARIKK